MAFTILLILAGLMGAGGVVLAAAGAHAAPHAGLAGAAYLLLFHATAILGGAALTKQGLLWRPPALRHDPDRGLARLGDRGARRSVSARLAAIASPRCRQGLASTDRQSGETAYLLTMANCATAAQSVTMAARLGLGGIYN
jgi:hypothetical protein